MLDSAVMTSMVHTLRLAVDRAIPAVRAGPGDAAARTAIVKALKLERARVERLDGELRTQVLRGELGGERWLAIAKTTAEGIRSISSEAVSWGRFWDEVLAQSAIDLGETVVGAVTGVARWVPWVAGGVVVVALLVGLKWIRS